MLDCRSDRTLDTSEEDLGGGGEGGGGTDNILFPLSAVLSLVTCGAARLYKLLYIVLYLHVSLVVVMRTFTVVVP